MDFVLNNLATFALGAAWYILSAQASKMSLPTTDSSFKYKAAFYTLQIVTGALERAKAARKVK